MTTSKVSILRLCVLIVLAAATSSMSAQEDSSAEADARAALDRFLAAFNSGDNALVRQELNYPHVTHGPNALVIANTPEDFAVPYDANRAQGWASSRWDTVTTHFVSDEKVNFGVEFSRLNEDGEVYLEGYVFYVFTNHAGHWGMQYRAGDMRRGNYDEVVLNRTRREATAALDEFFRAFNAADHDALALVHHVPQALIVFEDNNFVRADSMQSPVVRTNFDNLRDRENWARSEYEDVRILSATPQRVIFELQFQRVNTAGEVYMRIPATWVLVKKEDRWGMQFRSLMASTIE